MIYTNNIIEFAKKLENKLNETLGTKSTKIFHVTTSKKTKKNQNDCDGLLKIMCFWSMSISELMEIREKYLQSFFVTEGDNENTLQLWTTYKEINEEGQ